MGFQSTGNQLVVAVLGDCQAHEEITEEIIGI
jgi:hypothetical protein